MAAVQIAGFVDARRKDCIVCIHFVRAQPADNLAMPAMQSAQSCKCSRAAGWLPQLQHTPLCHTKHRYMKRYQSSVRCRYYEAAGTCTCPRGHMHVHTVQAGLQAPRRTGTVRALWKKIQAINANNIGTIDLVLPTLYGTIMT